VADEMIDIYDENLQRLGTVPRNQAHESGSWHRSIHCWIVRPDGAGYVLFQKRGREKKLYPNILDITAAGHYTAGETPEQGVREILEELGLDISFTDLVPLGIKFDIAKIGTVTNREFCDVYLLRRPEKPEDYKLDPSEVEGLLQISIRDGLRLFSGEAESVDATGVEWQSDSQSWKQIDLPVTRKSFIPRIDQYYLKVFILGRNLLQGERYLAI